MAVPVDSELETSLLTRPEIGRGEIQLRRDLLVLTDEPLEQDAQDRIELVIRQVEIQEPLETPRCLVVVRIQPEQPGMRARRNRHRRPRRQQLLERLTEPFEPEFGL